MQVGASVLSLHFFRSVVRLRLAPWRTERLAGARQAPRFSFRWPRAGARDEMRERLFDDVSPQAFPIDLHYVRSYVVRRRAIARASRQKRQQTRETRQDCTYSTRARVSE